MGAANASARSSIWPSTNTATCRRTDIVIARMPVRGQCDARLIIDRFDLAKKGAHAVWIGKAGDFRVETVADRRGQRPWTAK